MGVQKLNGKKYIEGFTFRWKLMSWLELSCYALASALLCAILVWIFTSRLTDSLLAFFISLLLAAALFYRRLRLGAIKPAGSASFLNRKVDNMEFSAELLLADRDTLSLPARLQQRRIVDELPHFGAVKPPVKLINALLWLCLSVLLAVFLFVSADSLRTDPPAESSETPQMISPADTVGTHSLQQQLPNLREGRLRVSPPDYTGQKAYFTEVANLRAPEGSRLTWQLTFDEGVKEVWLSRPQEDSVRFHHAKNDQFTAQLELGRNMLYQLVWMDRDSATGMTDYLRLEAVPDEAPQLRIMQPQQYIRQEDGKAFTLKATVADEWGLNDAYLSLTISRGSGEGVKFREKKLWFEQDFSAQPKTLDLSMDIDPKALEMEPGDELYYYLVAFDNRKPQMQKSRTETYFFQWTDTTEESSFDVSGMAMEIMPEYFRSQRQIIIDTEKLIEERPEISEEEFEKRSGNLGVDQKLLRLRYGKFLGEEFESGYGEVSDEGEHGEHRHEPHEHDVEHEDDHPDHEDEEHAGHEHGQEQPEFSGEAGSEDNPLRDFMHAHDTEEGATFYEEGVKVKLKAALQEMWESELRLRTLRPEEALPYEYRALEIIKDVQQATRIYVERVGFEPPPLRPDEKRLTGELKSARSASRSVNREAEDTLPAIRQLIPLLQSKGRANTNAFTSEELRLLKNAGDELAVVVQQQPRSAYLRGLAELKEMMNKKGATENQRKSLLKILLQVQPDENDEVKAAEAYRTTLEKRFMQQLGGAGD